MQLDIFEHSRDVFLRNAVVEALRVRDAAAAARGITELKTEFASDSMLPTFHSLRERLSLRVEGPMSRESAAEIMCATERVIPDARNVFGRETSAWLVPFWLELAAAMRGLTFDPDFEALHAAPILLRAQRWGEAGEALQAIPSWRRLPAPLAWRIAASARISDLDAIWPLLAELSWMAPQRAVAIIETLEMPELTAFVRDFDRELEGEGGETDFAWFPAWVLVAHPRLAEHFRGAQAGSGSAPERCARLLLNLLALERQGRHTDLVEARKRLRGAHPTLFERYMRSRT